LTGDGPGRVSCVDSSCGSLARIDARAEAKEG
jgi:hypothetical protein